MRAAGPVTLAIKLHVHRLEDVLGIRVSDGQRTYTLDVLEVKGKAMPPGQRDDSNGRAVAIGLLRSPAELHALQEGVVPRHQRAGRGGRG